MSARDLQQSLIHAVERARGIEIRRYEQREEDRLRDELLPAIREALTEAIEVFTQVIDSYSTPMKNDNTGTVADSAQVSFGSSITSEECGANRIADISFLARWELHEEREKLGKNSFVKETWNVINDCSSARRRLIASAIAIENAICAHEDLTSTLRDLYLRELNHSLQVRKVYAMFRYTVMGNGPPNRKNVRQRLRKIATAIDKFAGAEIYGDLRTTDRVQIEGIYCRLVEWLQADHGGDPQESLRLWQDIESLSELLLGINNRSELREYDRTVVVEAHNSLFRTDTVTDSIAEDLQVRLQSLLGRDAELDRLILNRGPHPAESWKRPLERALEGLNPNKQETGWPQVTPGLS